LKKRYPGYKNSGVEWIGEIPKHWSTIPNRGLFIERIERGFVENELLSVTISNGVIKQSDYFLKKDTSSLDKSNYKRVKKGDLVYNKMRMWQGAVGFSDYNGIVSPAYIILCPNNNISAKYYYYLFKTPIYIAEFDKGSYGICDDMNSLRFHDFKMIVSITPPMHEQQSIANHLDHNTSQIDTLIQKKQKQIELLKEQRTAIINQAVTKGLNPNVKMKDSGIEWLGEIPEHWEVRPLKYITFINKESLPEITDKDYEIQYIDIGNVNHDGLLTPPQIMDFGHSPSRARRVVKQGDIIVSTVRTYLKAIAYINSKEKNLIASTGFAVLSSTGIIVPKYLYFLISSQKIIDTISSQSKGVSYPAINSSDLGSIPIWFPNSIKEQEKILQHLEYEIEKNRKLIFETEKEISLLKEYRTTLISEAVTGKIDVREEVIP